MQAMSLTTTSSTPLTLVEQEKFSGWRVLGALSFVFLINMGFSQYGGTVLNAGTVLGLHFDRRLLGYIALITACVFGLSGPLTAWCMRRIGTGRTILVGSLIMALGMALNGTVLTRPWQFAGISSVLIGLGIGLSTQVPAQTCVARWFTRRRALAISLLWTAGGLGGFVAPPLLTRLSAMGTWRTGWLFTAVLMVLSGVAASLFVIGKPADVEQFADGVAPAGSMDDSLKSAIATVPRRASTFRSETMWTVRQAMHSQAFWMILLGALAQMSSIYVYLAHGILHLMDLGHTHQTAAFSVSVFAIGATAGKLLTGVLGDRFEPRLLWGTGALLMCAGMLGMVNATADWKVYACSVALGLGNGSSLVCWSTTVANYFGPMHFASIMGAQVPFVSILAAFAPLAAGLVFENHHSYSPVFYAVSVLSALSAVVLFTLVSPPIPPAELKA